MKRTTNEDHSKYGDKVACEINYLPTDDLCRLLFYSHLSCADGKKMDLMGNVKIELLEKSDCDPKSSW